MKLKYNILCIDDTATWIESMFDSLKEIVVEEGFYFEKDCLKVIPQKGNKIENAIDKINYEDYDIIFMDYNLGKNNPTGNSIIKDIRDNNHFTEVLFYSNCTGGEDELRKIISKDNIEGVYCSVREDHFFLDKFERIFLNSIKKIQDLNNLRGLIMAETSDLDVLKKEIIKKIINHDDNLSKEINLKIIEKIFSSLYSNLKKVSKYNGQKFSKKKFKESFEELTVKEIEEFGKSFLDLVEEFFFDFDKKRRTIADIVDLFKISSDFDHENYKKEIQSMRNDLAHKKERRGNADKGENPSSLYFGKTEFSYEICKKLRIQILNYKLLLEDINEQIDKIISQKCKKKLSLKN